MRLLRLAIEAQRWDLAAHVLVLAAAQVMKKSTGVENGEKANAGESAQNQET